MSDFMEQPGDSSDSDAADNAAEDSNNLANQVADDDQGENHDSDSQEHTEEEDDEEVEIGDKKVAMPKSLAEILKAERMKAGDYTQKTQSLAEDRRQLAVERENVQKSQQRNEAIINEIADVRSIERQLADIEKMNLAQFVQTDPQGVMEWQEKRRTLEAEHAKLVGSITQKQNEQALGEQQATAKQVQDAETYLVREIKGLDAKRIAEIQAYATATGMDLRAYAKAIITTPQVAVFAHKAALYDALIKKQAPKPPQTPAAKPAARVVGANAGVKRDPSNMTDAEFNAYRRNVSKSNRSR